VRLLQSPYRCRLTILDESNEHSPIEDGETLSSSLAILQIAPFDKIQKYKTSLHRSNQECPYTYQAAFSEESDISSDYGEQRRSKPLIAQDAGICRDS
jgi:hypothetical protein